MKPKVIWITRTAVMLALLVTLQMATKGFGQLVTGSCVNAMLALTVLLAGLSSGLTVALISPVLAFLLGIAPQILTVPAIMVGNGVYVLLLWLICGRTGKSIFHRVLAWLTAAAAKFAVLYGIVAGVICGLLAQPLLEAGTLKPPMIQALTATFSWPQLVTALIGGAAALLIAPVLRKAMGK